MGMRFGLQSPSLLLLWVIALLLSRPLCASRELPDGLMHQDWLEEHEPAPVAQAGKGELEFLAAPPETKVPTSQNWVILSESSLEDGWVQIIQCYDGLDAVPSMEVVYRFRNMRNLVVESVRFIREVTVEGSRVLLKEVQQGARLCIRTHAQILYANPAGDLLLRNGPFHRAFLDGYFPFHVTMHIIFPEQSLRFAGSEPAAQPGFQLTTDRGLVSIDSWFVGTLSTQVYFTREALPAP